MNNTKPASGNMYITIISSHASNTLDHLVLKIGNFNEKSTKWSSFDSQFLIMKEEDKCLLVQICVENTSSNLYLLIVSS